MLNLRVIPCLLLMDGGLVKTVRFGNPRYLGDPINIVRIFNDKEVDELILLDIRATPERRPPPFAVLETIASECFMPLCYGGGVRSLEDMKTLFSIGIEKVAVNSHALEAPGFITEAAGRFGSQSVVAAIDVKKSLLGGYVVQTAARIRGRRRDPVAHAVELARLGAGEILLTSVDRDGTYRGYDLELIRAVSGAVAVPVIACGGASGLSDVALARRAGASAAAAGSIFVYQGPHRAVLISYPTREAMEDCLAHG